MAVVSAQTRASIFGQPGRVERVSVMTPWGVRTQCHKLIAPLFLDACEEAARVSRWRPQRIDSFANRPIRGHDGNRLEEWSLHASCLGWDFFATGPNVPPPGGVWTPDNGVPEDFAACFERRGFRWGGRWSSRRDVPHIEWAGGRPPAVTPLPAPPSEEDDDMTPEERDMLNKINIVVGQLGKDMPSVRAVLDALYDPKVKGQLAGLEATVRRIVSEEIAKQP